MKKVVRKIDRALKRLYNLDRAYCAEKFLIPQPSALRAKPPGMEGAVYVRGDAFRSLSIGIYLSETVGQKLPGLKAQPAEAWTHEELSAFNLAVEEISHFNCLLFHAGVERPVSQLELEVQGEIDKFLLTYFVRSRGKALSPRDFSEIFEQLFFRFRWAKGLSDEQRNRYAEANALAKRFILQVSRPLNEGRFEKTFSLLRRFYRLDRAGKFSFVSTP